MLQGKKFYLLFLLFSLTGIVWLLLNYVYAGTVPVCIFRRITGLPCPSCGITGTIEALFGNYSHFYIFNFLGIILLPVMAIIPVWITADLIMGKESFYRFFKKSEEFLKRKQVAIPSVLLVLIIWIINIIQALHLFKH